MNGNDLRLMRRDMGMSQEEIAILLKVSAGLVCRWEKTNAALPAFYAGKLMGTIPMDAPKPARARQRRSRDELADMVRLYHEGERPAL